MKLIISPKWPIPSPQQLLIEQKDHLTQCLKLCKFTNNPHDKKENKNNFFKKKEKKRKTHDPPRKILYKKKLES